ncbi:MAG: sugar phosphate isomerase/epimerase family protein [Clostridia bacterium]|nr:sugar phosphate isomerase/epimerase family protein [Clostridia bacterium]
MSKFTYTGFSDEIDENIEKQFEHLNKLGINYFEPRGVNGKNISSLDDKEAEELKEVMNKHNIKVSSIGSPIGKIKITDDFDEHMKLLERTVRTAKILGAKHIRIFSFYIPEGEDYYKYTDEVMRRMKVMTEYAKKNDIILLHENEKGIYGDIAVRCEEILKTVNSEYLRAVFDPANFVQCGQVTYPNAFKLLKPYVVYMHIKDALTNGDVVPAGYGEGHVEEILTELYNEGYNGFLSLEPHLGSFKGLENLETDDHMLELEGSTPEKFTLAYESLKKIVDKIEG